MGVDRFEDLRVWQAAKQQCNRVGTLMKRADFVSDPALADQLIERALGSELTHHLGYPPGGEKPADSANHRNGSGSKTVLTDDGPLRIDVPAIATARSSRG